MKKIFDMDNPLMRGLSAAADLLVLNLLTLLCSLPFFTIGPAMTALANGCFRIAAEEGDTVAGDFFRAFRSSFRRSLPFGLILFFADGLLYLDYLAAAAYIPFMRYTAAALAVLLLALSLYTFALLARKKESWFRCVKQGALLAVVHAPKTALMLLVCLGLWTMAVAFLRYSAPVLLMFGLSLPGYVCAALMRPALSADVRQEKENENHIKDE